MKDQEFLETLKRMIKSNKICFGVDIEKVRAEAGDGVWYEAKQFIVIDGEWINVHSGTVEIYPREF